MEFCEAILDGFGYDALETISSVKSEIGKGEMRNFIYLLSDALELNKSHSMFRSKASHGYSHTLQFR